MEWTLEDQEHHLLVKVIDRLLYKLNDLVRPYVHKLLVVIELPLIDEGHYTRVEGTVEGCEIISNMSKSRACSGCKQPLTLNTDPARPNSPSSGVGIIVAARLMVSHEAEGEELRGIYHFVKEVTSPSPGCRS